MAYKVAYEIHGNKTAMNLFEGAWTDDDEYKAGGYFASPLSVGDYVELVTTASMAVKAAASASNPIGKVFGTANGENKEEGRWATIELYCDYVKICVVDVSSDAIAPGDSVEYFTAGTVIKAASANDTCALSKTAASGSIAAGDEVVVAFGRQGFT